MKAGGSHRRTFRSRRPPRQSLRAGIAWVGQKPHIFAGTVADNVALGRPEIGSDDVSELRSARPPCRTWPMRTANAPIGEGGIGLSGGEALAACFGARGRQSGCPAHPRRRTDRTSRCRHRQRNHREPAERSLLGKTLIVATHDPRACEPHGQVVVCRRKHRRRARNGACWSAFRPILALFLAERRAALLAGALLAAATVLAGIALLGLSGWFITATAIAGLSSATAFAFDVFAPSAASVFWLLPALPLATANGLTTHDATLGVLAGLREQALPRLGPTASGPERC